MDEKRELLRHTLATLAYRGGKAVRDAPEDFAGYRAAPGGRSPGQILAHIGDLLDWALSMLQGRAAWRNSEHLAWEPEVDRFFAALKALDDFLASDQQFSVTPEKIFQGPIADALTHVGQIAMLRRLAGCPVRGENYYVAHIETGQVGAEQPAPVREF
jgi:hypothetical protein